MSISTLAYSGAHSVDKLLGNAFLIVKEVQENLDAIRAAAFLINPDAFLKRTLAVPIGETAPTIDARPTLQGKVLGISPDGLRIIGIDPASLGGGGGGNGGDGGTVDPTDPTIVDLIDQIVVERERLNTQIQDINALADDIIANATSTAGIDSRLAQLALDFDAFDGVIAQIQALTDDQDGIRTLIVDETAARIVGDTALVATLELIGAKNGDNSAFILDLDTVKVSPTESFAERFQAISVEAGDTIALIQDETSARADAISAEVYAREQMGVQIRTDTDELISGAILDERLVWVAGDAAEAVQREALAVTLRGESSTAITAAVLEERTARIDGDEATATQLNGLVTRVGDSETAIIDEATARSDADGGLATQISSLTVRTTDAEAEILRIDTAYVDNGSYAATQATLAAKYAEEAAAKSTQALNYNPSFAQGKTLWGTTQAGEAGIPLGVVGSYQGKTSVLNHTGYIYAYSNIFPVKSGKYEITSSIYSGSLTQRYYLGIVPIDANGNSITGGSAVYFVIANSSLPVGWNDVSGIYDILANYPTAKSAQIIILLDYNGVGGGTGVDFVEIKEVTSREAAKSSAEAAAGSVVTANQHRAAASSSEGLAATYRNQASGHADNSYGHRQVAETRAQIAIDKAVEATNSAASAAQSAVLSASVGRQSLIKNPAFTDLVDIGAYPKATGWDYWFSAPTAAYRTPGLTGGWSWAIQAATGLTTGIANTHDTPIRPGWYVLECDFELLDGTINGSGVYISGKDAAGNEIETPRFALSSLKGSDGHTIYSAGITGYRPMRTSRLFQMTNPALTRFSVVFMASWGGFSEAQTAKVLAARYVGVRPATPSEIRDQTVLPGLEASITEQSTAIVDLQGRTSARWQVTAVAGGRAQLSVYADENGGGGVDIVGDLRVNGNLIVNGTVETVKIPQNAISNSAYYRTAYGGLMSNYTQGTWFDFNVSVSGGSGGGGGGSGGGGGGFGENNPIP